MDFYVDAHFPEHPKALAAGDAACWLYVCGLAYCRRSNSRGIIPKPLAARLVAKNGERLAKRLSDPDVGLWHDRGDHYEVNDYTVRNAKQLARTEKAKKAAEARWQQHNEQEPGSTPDPPKQNPTDAWSNAPSTPEHCSTDARAMPIYPKNQRTKEPSSSSTSGETRDTPPETSDDDDRTLVRQAFGLLADRDLAARNAATGDPVGDQQAWWRAARTRRWNRHRDQLRALDLRTFTNAIDLAAELDPAPAAKTAPLDQTRAADEARMTRAEQPPCPECGTRGGNGWLETDNGVIRCPTCTPARSHT